MTVITLNVIMSLTLIISFVTQWIIIWVYLLQFTCSYNKYIYWVLIEYWPAKMQTLLRVLPPYKMTLKRVLVCIFGYIFWMHTGALIRHPKVVKILLTIDCFSFNVNFDMLSLMVCWLVSTKGHCFFRVQYIFNSFFFLLLLSLRHQAPSFHSCRLSANFWRFFPCLQKVDLNAWKTFCCKCCKTFFLW